jgi:ABC-2 type transport system ATP-binding protein
LQTTPVISFNNVHKFYGKVHALIGVDLEVRPGEIFGFLGPNGAGKTTAIRCMLDLIRPASGNLRVLGLDPQRNSLAVRSQVGYLPGELHLDDSFDVFNLLQFYNHFRKQKTNIKRISDLAEQLELALDTPVRNLSKGNKQKVAVVIAMMHEPKLLLLDEPTSGLDPLVQQVTLQLIREAVQEGATVFFSSHVLSEVQGIATRVGIIRQGHVVEIASTAELTRRTFPKAHIHLSDPSRVEELIKIPDTTLISRENEDLVTLRVEGGMDAFIKALAAFPVYDLDIERASLEEVFLHFYG